MKTLLKKGREKKNLKTRELAQLLGIDQALVSKFESGTRKPTREQIIKLASVLEIDFETLMITWLKEKILHEIKDESLALIALEQAVEEMKISRSKSTLLISKTLQIVLDEIDVLKVKLDKFRQYNNDSIIQALELEYTFESNRMEGNTLTLRETNLVIQEGLTISGKSMSEHLDAINHQEAIGYIKNLIEKNSPINEREILSIHNLILRGIQPEAAGKYRKVQIMIKGSNCMPTPPNLIAKNIADFFIWYEVHKNSLHPVVLAAEAHERITTIYPFIDGNEKTCRLLMNLILLQNDYVIANITGNYENKMHYYQLLETAQTKNNKEDLLLFIAQTEKESLERYIGKIAQ